MKNWACGALALIAMAACESGTGPRESGLLTGKWVWPHPMAYDRQAALYRDSLRTYYAERGIDLDRYYGLDGSYRDSVSGAVFDSLLAEFTFTCPLPEAMCPETVWIERRVLRIDADSMHYRRYQDSTGGRGNELTDSLDFAYRVRGPYLVREFVPGYADSLAFGFPDDDVLILGPDTLIRSR
jgi:hypothetical protein